MQGTTPLLSLLRKIRPAVELPIVAAGGIANAEHAEGDSAHGSVAFGGALLAAATFALVGMLEAAMTNAAHDGERQAVYALNQLHAYDWLGWDAAFAAVLLATGLGARRNRMLPTPVTWVTIILGASLLTPAGFFGFILLPLWLIVAGLLLSRGKTAAPEGSQTSTDLQKLTGAPGIEPS